MNVDRRDFMKILSAGAVVAAAPKSLLADERSTIPPDANGILYDAALCIGCKNCEIACQKNNPVPALYSEDYKSDRDPYSLTMNKIEVYRNGDGTQKDREIDGYSFIKKACMHCADPDCVSACPATALVKDKATGIITWDKDACIGCRYCQVACPYLIPKFEYGAAIPNIVKCEMCRHVQDKGGIPGCCSDCPTGAAVFGKFSDILAEAKKRLTIEAGKEYKFPIADLNGGKSNVQPVKKYVNYVYGEKEGGGTQYLILSAVPYEKLGLPSLPDYSDASKSEGLQHTLYKGLIAPIVLLGGLTFAAYRTAKNEEKTD